MTNNVYLNDMNYNKNCYLSINTTGINRHKNKLFLINLIFPKKEESLVQIFVDEKNPKDDLEKFLEQVENYRLISFNGNSFDIPFINVPPEYVPLAIASAISVASLILF